MESINKYLLSFLAFLLYSLNVQAQTSAIDSLTNELSHHQKRDNIRVDLLNSLAYHYSSNDIGKSEENTIAANKLAEKLGYTKGLAKSYSNFSNIHITKSELDEALDDAIEGLKLYEEINNYKGITSSYNTLGTIYAYKSELDKSLEYFNKGLDVAVKNEDLKRQSDMMNNIGNISYAKGDLSDAILYYKKAIVLNERVGDVKNSLSTFNNIAVIYTAQGRSLEALDYFNKSLIINREDENKEEIASVTLNIGTVYVEREQIEKALQYFEEALQLSIELENKDTQAKCLAGMGVGYLETEEYSKALDKFTEALNLNKEIESKNGMANCLNQIGGVYLLLKKPKLALDNFEYCLELSTSTENKLTICYANISLAEAYFMLGDYPKALFHGLKGEKLAYDLALLPQQKAATKVLYETYEATGDLKRSLNYLKLHKTFNDSLFNKENIEELAELEYDYLYRAELDSASNRELKLTEEVKSTTNDLEKSQQNLLVGVIVFLSFALILGATIFFMKLRNVKSKTQNIVIEQRLLRSQMTPHFIFNSLSVLQGMILNREDKKAVSYLSKFSKLLRITLENSRDKTVSLNQELIAVENYLKLQNIGENKSYEYNVVVDDAVDRSIFNIPPMLIQPFIENAVEHGFKNDQETREIDVHLAYLNEKLICTITDNGSGIDSQKETRKEDKKSLSTTITSERLVILSKDFKMEGSIAIEDRKKVDKRGTVVTLIIPYKLVSNI
ncbi:MAG: tetratricopeptide (TPR) repeat protein [Patiriisocius sp.]|jgi:tetratricopeptide (TPR) repeat protein